MITINFDGYTSASQVIHAAQGGALLALGLAEAYAIDNNSKRIKFIPPMLFLISAFASILAIGYFLGNWRMDNIVAALDYRRGFYIYIAFACVYASTGLSQMTFMALENKGRIWELASLIFLGFIAILYFMVGSRVNADVFAPVMVPHTGIGFTLLAAVAVKAAGERIKHKNIKIGWAILLLITAFQLLMYKEIPQAFGPRTLTIDAGSPKTAQQPAPQPAAVKNAKTPPEKSAGH